MRFQMIPYMWSLTAYCGLYIKEKKKEGLSSRSPQRAPGGKGGSGGLPLRIERKRANISTKKRGFRESTPENRKEKTKSLFKEEGF